MADKNSTVTQEWATQYMNLRERIQKWNLPLWLGLPITWFGLSLISAIVLLPIDRGIAAISFGLIWLAFLGLMYLLPRRLLGFYIYSDLQCPACNIPVARFNNGWTIDWQCRDCGHPHARAAGLEDKAM